MKPFHRIHLIVMDSVGIGAAPDAVEFGDEGADTIGHIAKAVGGLQLPFLRGAGLANIANITPLGTEQKPIGYFAKMTPASRGKDTMTGHWELMGLSLDVPFRVFPDGFPPELIRAIEDNAQRPVIGNRAASGTQIIQELGPEQMRSGALIVYTSADSVLQIAAHEEVFGRERLLKLCEDIAPTLHALKLGRVIARPFIGDAESGFQRTEYRKDFAIAPPAETICDAVHKAGNPVYAVGKIGDIFSMRGIDVVRKGRDVKLMTHLNDLVDEAEDGAFIFVNFVEFDSEYGHRRDVAGYAKHLEWFNVELSRILPRLMEGDLLIVTADHGNDPTWIGTDHTRERVPVLVHGIGTKDLGLLAFADVGASVADHLNVPYSGKGRSFL